LLTSKPEIKEDFVSLLQFVLGLLIAFVAAGIQGCSMFKLLPGSNALYIRFGK
jgi:hypothetical protein